MGRQKGALGGYGLLIFPYYNSQSGKTFENYDRLAFK